MFKRSPFFGLLNPRSPMNGLLEQFFKISDGINIIKEALECYIAKKGLCQEFLELTSQLDSIGEQTDKVKHTIRDNLPRRFFMAVDKTLFLNCTSNLDDLMHYAQEALHWLGMREVNIPEEFQQPIINLLNDVNTTVELLEPALKTTIGLVHGEHFDRDGCKEKYRTIFNHRQKVIKFQRQLISRIYNSSMDFKDIYQLIHFVGCLNNMVNLCEACSDTLRAMIAR